MIKIYIKPNTIKEICKMNEHSTICIYHSCFHIILLKMEDKQFHKILLVFQLLLFLLGRILDDMSWYDVGVADEVNVFEGIGVAAMSLCVAIQIIRKHKTEGMWKILFFRSQLKFMISWALVTAICFLFFNIFGCAGTMPQTELVYFYILYTGCCLNVAQIVLTNLNYSLICNTKCEAAELVCYLAVLFGEVIYNGKLLILFVHNLTEKPKEYSILLVSLVIANQVLIMDLIFRAAYEEREREEERQESMLGHRHSHEIKAQSSFVQGNSLFVATLPEINSNTNIQSPKKKT